MTIKTIFYVLFLTLCSCALFAQNQTIKTYYDEQKLAVKEIIEQQNGVNSGPYLLYYEGGSLAVKGTYVNGKREGVFIDFFFGAFFFLDCKNKHGSIPSLKAVA